MPPYLGLRGQRHVEGKEVAESKRLVEGHQPHALGPRLLVGRVRVVRDNSETKALRTTRYLSAHLWR